MKCWVIKFYSHKSIFIWNHLCSWLFFSLILEEGITRWMSTNPISLLSTLFTMTHLLRVLLRSSSLFQDFSFNHLLARHLWLVINWFRYFIRGACHTENRFIFQAILLVRKLLSDIQKAKYWLYADDTKKGGEKAPHGKGGRSHQDIVHVVSILRMILCHIIYYIYSHYCSEFDFIPIFLTHEGNHKTYC